MDHKVNKYTTRLELLTNDIDTHIEKTYYTNNKLIKKIIHTYESLKHIPLNLTCNETIKKIHEYSDDPLIFMFINKMYKKGKNNISAGNDLKKFIEWYRSNGIKLNLKSICGKVKHDKEFSEFYDVMYNPPESRKQLHKLLYENLFVSLDVIHHAESENLKYLIYKNNKS